MKISVKEATVTSNVPQNANTMSISVDGMEHIMKLLTNLYKDPELAVVREYFCNSIDAHVAAGTDKPVLVTLPTWDDPVYTVQDFGIGMSEWDIQNVYSQYGASTKRDTNDQVGAFGLGCKSAFTIANQFTVVSVKDGMKCTTLFSKAVNGTYTSNPISNVPTADGNGTIVKIPVSARPYFFNDKATKFFRFSPPGSVLVDGVQPEYALDSAQKLENPNDPDMAIFLKAKADGESYVIMGGVPYAMSHSEIELSLERLGVNASRGFVRMPKYFRVPIGAVDLTPSREGLQFTDMTNGVIDAHISFIVNDLREIAIKELDASATLEDFFEAHKRWNDIVSVKRAFKGEEVPTEVNLDTAVRTVDRSDYGGASHSVSTWIALNKVSTRYIVTGHSADKYKKVNGYLTPYMEAEGISNATFMITDSKDILTNKWILMSSKFTILKGDDIIEIGRERRKQDRLAASKVSGTAKKTKIQYPVLNIDDEEVNWINHDEIAEDTPYLSLKDVTGDAANLIRTFYKNPFLKITSDTMIVRYFETVTDAKEIILLGNSRTVKALEQRVKGTKSLLPEIVDVAKSVKGHITDDVITHDALERSAWRGFLTGVSASKSRAKVVDPDIVEIITPPQSRIDAFEKYQTVRETARYFSYPGMGSLPSIGWADATKATKALDQKYPLINAINLWNLDDKHFDHIVRYFNMIHEDQSV